MTKSEKWSLRRLDKSQEEHRLNVGTTIIGRSSKVNVDILIRSVFCSKEHCRIYLDQDEIKIVDKSTNGVYVNDRKIDGFQMLRANDVIGLGCTYNQMMEHTSNDVHQTCFLFRLVNKEAIPILTGVVDLVSDNVKHEEDSGYSDKIIDAQTGALSHPMSVDSTDSTSVPHVANVAINETSTFSRAAALCGNADSNGVELQRLEKQNGSVNAASSSKSRIEKTSGFTEPDPQRKLKRKTEDATSVSNDMTSGPSKKRKTAHPIEDIQEPSTSGQKLSAKQLPDLFIDKLDPFAFKMTERKISLFEDALTQVDKVSPIEKLIKRNSRVAELPLKSIVRVGTGEKKTLKVHFNDEVDVQEFFKEAWEDEDVEYEDVEGKDVEDEDGANSQQDQQPNVIVGTKFYEYQLHYKRFN